MHKLRSRQSEVVEETDADAEATPEAASRGIVEVVMLALLLAVIIGTSLRASRTTTVVAEDSE